MSEEESKTNQTFSRPVRLSDLFDAPLDTSSKNKYNRNYSHNVSIQKNQQEFGQRKRIKPWRTGTKSQQQIVPKGFKKGFRG